MACQGICRILTATAQLSVGLFALANILDLLPGTVNFTEFQILKPCSLTGKLAVNTYLDECEQLFVDELKGPEGFAVVNGELYTSIHGGQVVKIKNNKTIPVVKFGEPCEDWWEEEKCGRPLGLAATPDGKLIVADAYYGIWKYDPKTNKSTVLVRNDTVIDGVTPKIFNSVAVGKDGSIYWSHSSSDFHLYNGVFTMLADPSGRLLKYDPITKKNKVLLDKIYFANGVALSEKEDFVLVAETGSGRIRRVHLKGANAGESDILMDGLPGLPDNIRGNGRGGFLVALNLARDEDNPAPTDYITAVPFARKSLARVLAFAEKTVEGIHILYPTYFTKRIQHFIGHFEMLSPFYPNRATIVEFDAEGNVLESYHGTDGSVRSISDMIAHDGHLYIGSPFNKYLGRVKLSKFDGKLIEHTVKVP